jgi:hypothetical protein
MTIGLIVSFDGFTIVGADMLVSSINGSTRTPLQSFLSFQSENNLVDGHLFRKLKIIDPKSIITFAGNEDDIFDSIQNISALIKHRTIFGNNDNLIDNINKCMIDTNVQFIVATVDNVGKILSLPDQINESDTNHERPVVSYSIIGSGEPYLQEVAHDYLRADSHKIAEGNGGPQFAVRFLGAVNASLIWDEIHFRHSAAANIGGYIEACAFNATLNNWQFYDSWMFEFGYFFRLFGKRVMYKKAEVHTFYKNMGEYALIVYSRIDKSALKGYSTFIYGVESAFSPNREIRDKDFIFKPQYKTLHIEEVLNGKPGRSWTSTRNYSDSASCVSYQSGTIKYEMDSREMEDYAIMVAELNGDNLISQSDLTLEERRHIAELNIF